MTATAGDVRSELRSVLDSMLSAHASSERVREVAASPAWGDEQLWNRLTEVGVHALSVPEALGGAGESIELSAVVLEAAGAHLPVAPLLSSQVAARLLANIGEPASALLPGLLDGSSRLTSVIAHPGEPSGARWPITATGSSGEVRLSGQYPIVLDGADAAAVLVQAQAPDGVVVAVVKPTDTGVELGRCDSLDLTRRIARLSLADAPASVLASGEAAERALERTQVEQAYLLAAEQLGAAQRCLDMSTSYAKTRVQFGKPIGVFQAISHSCANMYVEVEATRSLVEATGGALASDDWDEARQYAAALESFASETLLDCAQRMVQIHGGIAITWEFDAHLYLRRAKSTEVLFGRPSAHRAELLDLALAATEAKA